MTVLAIIGLVVGLVVLLVVIKLLAGTLAPLRAILADVEDAKTAQMLDQGVKGADQLSTTRRLADSVPDLAMRYLQKLGSSPRPAPAYTPAPAPPEPQTQSYTPAAPAPAPTAAPAGNDRNPEPPAWKRYL